MGEVVIGGGPVYPDLPTGAFVEQEERAAAVQVDAAGLLSDYAGDVVEAVEVEDGTGRRLKFHIKKLDMAAIMSAEAKRYRVESTGAVKRNLETESILGTRAELVAAVVRNDGTDDSPRWLPYFKPDDLFRIEFKNKAEVRTGLMASTKASTLIDNLLNEVWRVNPIFSPVERAKQAGTMQQIASSPDSSTESESG